MNITYMYIAIIIIIINKRLNLERSNGEAWKGIEGGDMG